MAKPIPEHVVDQMAKEIAKLIAAVYPKLSIEQLEQNTRAVLASEQPSVQVVGGPWPWLPTTRVLSIPVAWFDLTLGRAQVGDADGPRFWFEEQPDRAEWEAAYWEGKDVF
jgi:hypothetical protein